MGMYTRSSMLLAAFLAAVFLLAGPVGAVSNGERAAESYLLVLVNRDRSSAHLGSLKEQSYIRGQAEAHTTDMLNRQSMDHNGFSQRVSNIRTHVVGMKYSGVCENVAYARGYTDSAKAMAAINSAWLASSDHHRCMMDQLGWSSQSAGVGVRYDGHTYWATFISGHNTSP